MWVPCSPPIARVQQRLVVNLVDVTTLIKSGAPKNISLGGSIPLTSPRLE